MSLNFEDISPDNMPLDFVKQYLKVEHDFDDIEIMMHIKSAQSYVRTYTKTDASVPLDDGLLFPILALVAHFYENKSPMMKSTEKLEMLFSSVLDMHRNDVLGEF